jgi:RNA polymerase sigma factor (sigma-70 family)
MAISHFRSQKKIDHHNLPLPVIPDPEEKMIQEERHHNIWNTAMALSPKQYKVLWLYYVEEMPIKDMAQVLKNNPITVRVLLHRARLKLAEVFSPSQEADSKVKRFNAESEKIVL